MNQKVLVLDDDERNRTLLTDLLVYKGLVVIGADTGEDAIEKAAEDMIFAILDLRLPDISGYEVAKAIKEKYPKLPLIVYTASPLQKERDDLYKSDLFDAVLLKPIELKNFEEIINKFIK
jgi:two-component system aerobic respiration control sensor histidine kinase ArcB